jgi:hypothetical protein
MQPMRQRDKAPLPLVAGRRPVAPGRSLICGISMNGLHGDQIASGDKGVENRHFVGRKPFDYLAITTNGVHPLFPQTVLCLVKVFACCLRTVYPVPHLLSLFMLHSQLYSLHCTQLFPDTTPCPFAVTVQILIHPYHLLPLCILTVGGRHVGIG